MICRDPKADFRNRFWEQIPLPKGYTVEHTEAGLLVRLHWFSLPQIHALYHRRQHAAGGFRRAAGCTAR